MIIGESLAKYLDKALEENYLEERREYIGASSIGNPCSRAIWYAFKGMVKKPLEAKQIRTFETGNYLEVMLKEKIKRAAIELDDGRFLVPGRDRQLNIFQGTPDAIIIINNEKLILEIKTANDSSFNNFVKKGCKEWNPQYYSQVQAYMGFTDGKVAGAYILVLNKNTGVLHDEYLQFDEILYHELREKAKRISEATEAPERINKNPMFYLCSMCQYKEVCHGVKPAPLSA